jgi:hypothetical protein
MAQAKSKAVTVAKARVPVLAAIQDKFAAELEDAKRRLSAPTGDRITVTQDKMFKLPDGRETAGPFNAVIVDFVASSTYYEQGYTKGVYTPPVCFAIGLEPAGLVPSDASTEKQAESCASCWANQFGSSGKGKACSNNRMLALLDPNADEATPLMLLKVSPTALRAFDGYVASVMRQFKVPIRAVLTEIGFNENLDYASLTFGNPRPLIDDLEPLLLLADSRQPEALNRLLTEPEFQPPAENAASTPAPTHRHSRGAARAPAKPVAKPAVKKRA